MSGSPQPAFALLVPGARGENPQGADRVSRGITALMGRKPLQRLSPRCAREGDCWLRREPADLKWAEEPEGLCGGPWSTHLLFKEDV